VKQTPGIPRVAARWCLGIPNARGGRPLSAEG
jgi:hypothetical protein